MGEAVKSWKVYKEKKGEKNLNSERNQASLVGQIVKNSSSLQEIQSLGQEVPLEKGVANHSSELCNWRIPWTEESGGLQPMGSQRVGHN